MTEITHTIDADTDETFRTAADWKVTIYSVDDSGTMDLDLVAPDHSETQEWEWSNDKVVEHLIEGNLIPQEGNPTDYLSA